MNNSDFSLPIKWDSPENDSITTRYANNIVVQFSENEFVISFFETRPPIILGSQEEREAQVRNLEHIQAYCVARIVIAIEKMPQFIKALEDNYEKYQVRFNSEPGEEK